MAIVVSIGIWAAISFLTISLFFVESVLTAIVFPFDKKRKIIHSQCFWWADAVIALNPYWHLQVSGLRNIDRHKAYIIVANHQSLADIVIMYKSRMQFKWVAKKSLFKVPFIGWCLSLTKHMKLSRGKFSDIKRVYREAAYWLKNDMSVLFFPEGTRTKTGRMGKFQNGAFKLAIQQKKSILPIVVSGTREAIPRGSWIFKTKVRGKLTILPPVETAHLQPSDFGSLKNTVYRKLESFVT